MRGMRAVAANQIVKLKCEPPRAIEDLDKLHEKARLANECHYFSSENHWTATVHIAASEGDISMINELSKHFPDCWEMLNSSGQNALHVSILNNQEKVVESLLKSKKLNSLVDEPDNDGNTPLHLLAASNWHRVPVNLRVHSRSKRMSFNKENQIPLDVASSGTKTTTNKKRIKYSLGHDFINIGGWVGRHFPKRTPHPKDAVDQQRENLEAKECEISIKAVMQSSQIHLVVWRSTSYSHICSWFSIARRF